MTDDRIPGSEEPRITRHNGTKPQAGDGAFAVPGAAGRPDTGDRRGEDYVESQPGGRRDDLVDRANRPPGRRSGGGQD
ncbi:hypothetical protein [Phreatobacter cathodiphilus]|uniref:Uncharacterized protein n=1 Tax=Phreatobacter cathodiphilus TaxID=1868589 RepID=A0A2S0N864_9HYPH|nr:hypothetical protein [Phreatobacter cathodiphilus]AVO44121.1 hypothetical protein C6569_03045 [Phreatobacter cathodiphilus]